MRNSADGSNLRIELDTKHCELSADEIRKMEGDLGQLAAVAGDFPISDLYITVTHHPRTHDYQVKTALVLTGRTLFASDTDDALHPTYERCVRRLVKRVEAYKHQMGNGPETAKTEKGTRQEVVPTAMPPELEAIDRAVEDGDYRAFREALLAYEEPVRKRIGRWVQRYPEIQAEIDRRITIADLVEEVFLTAFEYHDRRPADISPGEWLEGLIDPSLKELVHHFDEEMENIEFARTLQETPAAGERPEEVKSQKSKGKRKK